jgi:two-component SAPR family response regulator
MPATRAPVEIWCFDGPRITCGTEVLWPRTSGRRGGDAKPWEFLLYLACQRTQGVRAEVAVEALWPGGEDVDHAHRFRQLRYRLRQALSSANAAPETDGVSLAGGVLRLDPGVVHSDAQEFLELVNAARSSTGSTQIKQLERARSLYTGDLLAGPGARVYAWVDERDSSGVTLREQFRSEYLNAMSRLAAAYSTEGRSEEALELYGLLTELSPADEHHWSALFRLHARRGDRLGLLREERRLRNTLRELAVEIGQAGDPVAEEPSRTLQDEYRALLDSLRTAETETAAV